LALRVALTTFPFALIKVKDEIYLYSFAGERLKRLASDFVGAASVTGQRSKSDFFVTMTGFTTPGVVARFDFNQKDENHGWSIYRTTSVSGLDPEDFVAEQVRIMVPAISEIPEEKKNYVNAGLVREQGWYQDPDVYRATQVDTA
jgi:hypothetical protein